MPECHDESARLTILGNDAAERGENDSAEEYFRQAVELNTNHSGSHRRLGACLDRSGRHLDAEKAFRRVFTLKGFLASQSR